MNKNDSSNNAVNNTSGWGIVGQGYQAGITDQGNGDTITKNTVCGIGYTPVTPPPYLYFIDTTATNNVTLKKNKTRTSCGDGGGDDTGARTSHVLTPSTSISASATR